MKKRILAVFGIVMLAVAVVASPVLASSYTETIGIVNYGTNSYGEVPFMAVQNNTYLINNSYIDPTGLDVAVTSSSGQVPAMLTNYATWIVPPSVSANSSYSFSWSSGNVSTFTNGTGTCTGSPINLTYGITTIAVTGVGSFTLQANNQLITVVSGTTTVTGSPVLCTYGANTINTSGSTGNIRVYLSMPIIMGYDGYDSIANNAALQPGSSFTSTINGFVNTTNPNSGNTLTNATGVATGSPISLTMSQTTTVAVTTLGNFTLTVNGGAQDVITSGTSTITDGSLTSPITLTGGTYTLTASGSTGNFTIAVADNMYVVSKLAAVQVYVDPTTSGTIDTAVNGLNYNIVQQYSTTSSNADADEVGGAYWLAMNFTASAGAINGIGVYCYSVGGSQSTTTLMLESTSGGLPTNTILASGTISTMVASQWNTVTFGSPYTLSGGTVYAIVAKMPAGSYGSNYWTWSNVAGSGVTSSNNSGGSWGTASYQASYETLSALPQVTGISSGVHTVTVSLLSGTLTLTVDSTNSSVSFGSSVNSNGNAWYIDEGNVMPYINYYTEIVSGTEVLRYQPVTLIQDNITAYTTGKATFSNGSTTVTNPTTTYTTGTATFTNGSSLVTGAGTTWAVGMVGGQIKGTDGVYYTIASVPSTTTLYLTANFADTTESGVAYTMNYYTTVWTQQMVGGSIEDTTDGVYYVIHSVEGIGSLTLMIPYANTGGVGAVYQINYYVTSPLIDLDSTQNGVINYGVNQTLGVQSGVNNEPTVSSFAPVGASSLYTPPTTTQPDLAGIVNGGGGQIQVYNTGTATFTNGSKAVVGVGTVWTSQMVGGQIEDNTDGVYYTIAGVTTGTNLALVNSYGNAGGAGAAYTLQFLNGGYIQEDKVQANNLFTPLFQPFATQMNVPLLAFLLFWALAIQLTVVVVVLKYTQNQIITGIAELVVGLVWYSVGLYQLWGIILCGLVCLAVCIWERKPAL